MNSWLERFYFEVQPSVFFHQRCFRWTETDLIMIWSWKCIIRKKMTHSPQLSHFPLIEPPDFILWFNNSKRISCHTLFIYGMRIMSFILIIFKEDTRGLSLTWYSISLPFGKWPSSIIFLRMVGFHINRLVEIYTNR